MAISGAAVGSLVGPPGQGGSRTYASVLGRGRTLANENNVLEVVLEKDSRGGFFVTELECSNLMRKLGLDQRPGGGQVLGVQICPSGRGVIYITLRKDADVSKYCRYDVLAVTSSGVRAVLVKPAGRREAVVTLRGVHPNTSDDYVMEYLAKFGDLVTRKVVYGVFSEGPLAGLRNGDRSYKIEIKSSTDIGSYHVLDGQRISLKFPGQQQTCARCLQSAQHCKGKGVARRCETEGGIKADFNNYILELWKKIGYSPPIQNVEEVLEAKKKDIDIIEGEEFTPSKVTSDPDKFSGVRIKNIPKDVDHGRIVELLVQSGLPDEKKEQVTITNNGSVTITDLQNQECLVLIKNIHGKQNFDRKLYCNGYIPLTPEKSAAADQASSGSADASQVETTPAAPLNDATSIPLPPCPSAAQAIVPQTDIPLPGVVCSSPKSLPDWNVEPHDWSEDTEEVMVRRYSLSLRTPPRNSLAADILGVQQPQDGHQVNQQHVQQAPLMAKSIMSSIKDLQEALSDFNSCQSTVDDSGSSSESCENLKNSTSARQKRKKKSRNEYSRGDFLKKQDTKISPK